MPRYARDRSKNQPHHIICRSIEELLLFNTGEDKEFYINLISAASKIHKIDVLTYCLMDNHVHIMIHPRGGDISDFMHSINNAYAKYYNKINERRGHLFSERFKNIVIKDMHQLLRNSTYVHNNPKALLYQGYKSIDDYPYSSIKDYTQPGKGRGLAKVNYIYGLMGGTFKQVVKHYRVLLNIQSQGNESFTAELEDDFNACTYMTDKEKVVRNLDRDLIINKVADIMGVNNIEVTHLKYNRSYMKFKRILAICLRIYGDLSLSDMTSIFANHTSSTIGLLARKGFRELEIDQQLYDKIMVAMNQ